MSAVDSGSDTIDKTGLLLATFIPCNEPVSPSFASDKLNEIGPGLTSPSDKLPPARLDLTVSGKEDLSLGSGMLCGLQPSNIVSVTEP